MFARPLVVAHYMPWFEAKPERQQWGWHWTMNTFRPQQVANGKRQIASHYYPLIGPYDSGDVSVIEYHFLLMKLAGIDGIIVDWYGLSDLFDYANLHRNTAALFKTASQVGLKIGICYEDQTIPKLVEAKRLSADERVAHATRELQWLGKNWFSQPAYLKVEGKPLLLSFGWNGLSDTEWEQVLRSSSSPPLYFSEHRRRSTADGAFDWPVPQRGLAALDAFYQAAKQKRVYIPVAFPRFHDIYKEAKVGDSYGYIPDDRGNTFAATLTRAWNSGTPLVQIATWNDWGEGTIIEPSKEFGYRDLELVQKLRRTQDSRFKRGAADLRLPYRLWELRQRQASQPQLAAKMDSITRLLSVGNISAAKRALLETERTVSKKS